MAQDFEIEQRTAEEKLNQLEKKMKRVNIYSIVDRRTNAIVFVGITAQNESQKMASHRSCARAGNTQPIHEFMRLNGIDNYRIIPLEVFRYTESDSAAAAAREQFWIEQFRPICNAKVQEKKEAPIKCYCGCVIQGVGAMKRHLNLTKHQKIVDSDPTYSIRTLFE